MNRLANEISPYLIQHKDNPVDWYPWNNTAIQKAKAENKPIFLSIGYAACHWCHVMAHESFENETVAQILNQHYISIKVDREERPDIDQIYMSAVVALTGQGGWPLSVFLTPDLKPFYGGTYFPPLQRYGLPSFTDILLGIMQAWQNEPEKIIQISSQLTQHISDNQTLVLNAELSNFKSFKAIDSAHTFSNRFDWQHGGWGEAPKFPAPMTIDFLLQCSSKAGLDTTEMAFQTLHQMAQGGIYDLIDGGFHRYSTDRTWTVPHFEKMLYDNAQLASTYTHAFQKSANPIFKRIAENTLNYLLLQMKHPDGAFYSSQDADANGTEGTYYLWTMDELHQHAIPEGILTLLDLPPNGHIDHQYLLKINNVQKPESKTYADFESIPFDMLSTLLKAFKSIRAGRPKPAIDDKIILSWNVLAINAFLDAGMVFNNARYTNVAMQCAEFLRANMLHNGHLSHTWRDGKASGLGFLEDYAGYSQALLRLYTATSEPGYYQTAKVLIEKMMHLFAHNSGLLQNTAKTEENLISPVLDFSDMVTPSGMSMAVRALIEYSALNPPDEVNARIDEWLNLTQDQVSKHPAAYAYWLQQFLAHQTPQTSFILSYSDDQSEKIEQLRNVFYKQYRPNWMFMAVKWEENNIRQHAEILHDKSPVNNELTLYFCENLTCKQPITNYRQMLDILN